MAPRGALNREHDACGPGDRAPRPITDHRRVPMNDQQTPMPLATDELSRMNAWWRAANFLSVGQVYLLANPLLREPLRMEHVKPRLLGHWGTTPGLNCLYLHLNRIITERDLNLIFIA